MYEQILHNVARHITLTSAERDYFVSILQHRKFRKRQYMLQAGRTDRYENFVIKGLLRAYSVDSRGQEHIVMFAPEDWWISDLYSVIAETPATLNIDAMEDTEVLSIEKPDLEELFLKAPKFERLFRILLQNAFIAQQQRILNSISQTAEERYLQFRTKYADIEQRVPQHQIASYLGITPETLSRIRRQLAE